MSLNNPDWVWCSECKKRHYYVAEDDRVTWLFPNPLTLKNGETLTIDWTVKIDAKGNQSLPVMHRAYVLHTIER